jgi:hypothetical protein
VEAVAKGGAKVRAGATLASFKHLLTLPVFAVEQDRIHTKFAFQKVKRPLETAPKVFPKELNAPVFTIPQCVRTDCFAIILAEDTVARNEKTMSCAEETTAMTSLARKRVASVAKDGARSRTVHRTHTKLHILRTI